MRSVAVAGMELHRGHPVIVVDDSGLARIVIDAASASAQGMAFLARHGSGVVCAVMSAAALDALDLHPQSGHRDNSQPDYAVTVDLIEGVTTGISSADRAATLRGLADPAASAGQFCRPGHVMPVRAEAAGVLGRRDGFHAALDLAVLAGGSRCVGIDTLIAPGGDLLTGPALMSFATEHAIPVVTVAQVVAARLEQSQRVTLRESLNVRLTDQLFTAHSFEARYDNEQHTVLTLGFLGNVPPALVRTHIQCPVGNLPLAQECACQVELEDSLRLIGQAGRGVVIILRTVSAARPLRCAKADVIDGATVSQLLDRLNVSMTAREPMRRTMRRQTVTVATGLALVG